MSIQLMNEKDSRSKLLNMNKRVWLKGALETYMTQTNGALISINDTNNILNKYNGFITKFNKSQIGIKNVNEATTVDVFILPFLQLVFSGITFKAREHSLVESGSKLDILMYKASDYNSDGLKINKDSGSVFIECKKASLFSSKVIKNTVEDVAAAHPLLAKHGKDRDRDRLIIKGAQRRQMVDYLDSTKLTDGECTSLGVITNGLSYYIMMACYNDPNSTNQSSSILYELNVAELAKAYRTRDKAKKQSVRLEAQKKISTFINIVLTFMSLSDRRTFIDWYKAEYNSIYINVSNANLTDSEADYDAFINIISGMSIPSDVMSTYREYKKIMNG